MAALLTIACSGWLRIFELAEDARIPVFDSRPYGKDKSYRENFVPHRPLPCATSPRDAAMIPHAASAATASHADSGFARHLLHGSRGVMQPAPWR
jgi:hypothetical protein